MIPTFKAKLHEGKRGLVVGIANGNSIAWGCAAAFRALGAELAVTYANDKSRKFVEPLAKELEAKIFMPLDVTKSGEMEAAPGRLPADHGHFRLVVHPHGPSCGTAHAEGRRALHHDLLRKPDGR